MHISIDTSEPLSNMDVRILAMLIGSAGLPDVEDVEQEEEEAAPVPAKKTTAKKTAAKKPEPEPEPEPMAEEELEEEEAEEDDVIGDEDEMSDEDLLALAVKKATEMVAGGEAAKVREYLLK